MWRRAYIAALLVLALLAGYSSDAAASAGVERFPFVYYYSGYDSLEVIEQLDRDLRSQLGSFQDKLGVQLSDLVHIHITQEKAEFYRKTHGRVPSWAGGVTYPAKNLIIVKNPLFFDQGVPLSTLTKHEVVHILLHSLIKDNYLPRWLDEGICIQLSGEMRRGAYSRLGRAALVNKLILLPRIDGVLKFSSPDADLAYSEAQSAVEYFVQRFKWPAMKELLSRISNGEEFEEAFWLSTGVGLDMWQSEWMKDAKSRYKWFFLLDLEYIIWMLIVLLALGGGSIVLWRRKRQLKQMDDDEPDDEDDEDDWWSDWETPVNWKVRQKKR